MILLSRSAIPRFQRIPARCRASPHEHDADDPCDSGHRPDVNGGSTCGSDEGGGFDTEATPTSGDEPPVDSAGTTGETCGGETGGGETGVMETGDLPPEAVCGNAMIEVGEVCDDGINDGAYDGVMQDPTSIGVLACDPATCTFDVASCSLCGNWLLDAGEVCDGAELAGASCEALGFAGGALACDAQCGAVDSSGCVDAVDGCCIVWDPAACEVAEVTSSVCEQAPECCKVGWDELCVDIAIKMCFAQCA